jgi:hypothetical protein
MTTRKAKQIPCGNDSKKGSSRFPVRGMTRRKAAGMTTRKAEADSLRE